MMIITLNTCMSHVANFSKIEFYVQLSSRSLFELAETIFVHVLLKHPCALSKGPVLQPNL